MNIKKESPHSIKRPLVLGGALCASVLLALGVFFGVPELLSVSYVNEATSTPIGSTSAPVLDTLDYDMRLLALAHVATSSMWYEAFLSGATTTRLSTATSSPLIAPLWPTRKAYPRYGALLPFNRIVAYYGNYYSTGMGILGEYPEEEVLKRLREEVAAWEQADPSTPVVPAIEYIDVTAQKSAGKDGKYRLRMPDSQIDKALAMAKKIEGIVVLEIQVGLSTVEEELPLLEHYLAMPQVHLALDPEFAMHGGVAPGRVIGTMSAEDINWAVRYLSNVVKVNNVPPKILIVHRFTEEMVTSYQRIEPSPEVQVVMNMDGWGFGAKKINTYNSVIYSEPVQFTGIKLFYKNDLKPPSTALLTLQEILGLTPTPIYIQYQ